MTSSHLVGGVSSYDTDRDRVYAISLDIRVTDESEDAMSRSQPIPVFAPWNGKAMEIRHHEHRDRVGRIAETAGGWHLTWSFNHLKDSTHATSLEAVATARDAYPDYLAAEYEATREFQEQQEYEERFLRGRASAVARALRVPTGGQKGWQNRRPSRPETEK